MSLASNWWRWLSQTFQNTLDRYVHFSLRRRWGVLAVGLLFTVLAGGFATRLSVNPRLEALLPSDTDSAQSLSELQQRLKGSSPLYLVVQAAHVSEARRLARRLHTEVSQWPETEWAMYKRDPGYLSDARLLYLSETDLEALDEQIDERRRWDECKRIPGCVNLDDEAPPLPTDADVEALFQNNADLRTLASLFGKETQAFAKTEPGKTTEPGTPAKNTATKDPATAPAETASKPETNKPETDEELGELCDVKKSVCAVQASLKGDPANLAFATKIMERSEQLFEQLKQDSTDAELKLAVSGQYRNVPMTQRAVREDLAKTSFASAALVLVLVLSLFKGIRSVALLFIPVVSGTLWTAGFLGAFSTSLNLISAFTLAVLASIGIDFGMHLLTHYSHERAQGHGVSEAMSATYRGLAPALLVAAATSACSFLALGVASFRGFAEMGPIAAAGIVTALVASLLLFPPLVAVLDHDAACPFLLRRYGSGPWGFLRRRAGLVTALGIALGLGFGSFGLGAVGEGVEFEYNFRKLEPKSVSHGIPWANTLHGTTRTAVYLLADDHQALTRVAEALRANPPQEVVDGSSPFLVVPAGFIPPNQDARLAAIGKLNKTLSQAREHAGPELQQRIDTFSPLVSITEPIAVERMPRWVLDWLTERDGRFGTLAILYSHLGGSDARQMEQLAHHLDEWRMRFPDVRFASPVAQLGEVTPRLRAEAPKIILLAFTGVFLGTLLIGRSLRRSLIMLLPLLVMVSLSLGAMALGGIKINLYNMLVFPLALGLGVDGAVFVSWAFASGAAQEQLPVSARAVLGCTLTSAAGFGSLMSSSNPGLFSIGLLTVVMLGASLLANLLWLPAALWARGAASESPSKPA